MQSYNLPQVNLVTQGLDCITEKGIKTKDGKEFEFDVIVLATGFDILKSANSAYKTVGRDSETSLNEVWKNEPYAYNGTVMVISSPFSYPLVNFNTFLH